MSRVRIYGEGHIPYMMLGSFNKAFPNLIEQTSQWIDLFKGRYNWNSDCIVPLWICKNVIRQYSTNYSFAELEARAIELQCIYSWNKYLQNFIIQQDLANKILSNLVEVDKEIPKSVFTKLPFNVFYVDTRNRNLIADIDGFFVYYDYSTDGKSNKGRLILKFSLVRNEVLVCTIEFDPQKSIIDSVNEFYESESDFFTSKQEMCMILSVLLAVVDYISLVNVELSANSEQKKIYKPSNSNEPMNEVETQEWEQKVIKGQDFVMPEGEKTVNNVKPEICYYDKTGKKKQPHVRRGHEHHYWVGSKKKGTRRLVKKDLKPMEINGGNSDNKANVIEHDVN